MTSVGLMALQNRTMFHVFIDDASPPYKDCITCTKDYKAIFSLIIIMTTRRPEPLPSARPRTLIIADGDYPGEVNSRNRSEALSGNIPNIAEYDW